MLYDADRGNLLAVIDGTSITAVRTAAVSGVATKLLAREECRHLAIIGSGVQAGVHLQAMLQCRSIDRVTVFSKTLDRAERFAESASKRHAIPVQAMRSCKEAVEDADIICTTTSAREPVLKGGWLAPGTHINAVGSSVNFARELDGEAVQRSRLFVDRRESALNEAGDFLLAKKEGLIGDDHIVMMRHGQFPQIRIHEVEIRGPLIEQWPTEGRRSILGDEPFTEERTSEILKKFADRAYRRLARPGEIETLMRVVADRREAGAPNRRLSALADRPERQRSCSKSWPGSRRITHSQ